MKQLFTLLFLILPFLSLAQKSPKTEELQATIERLKAELEDARFELKIANNQYKDAVENCNRDTKSELEGLRKTITSREGDLRNAQSFTRRQSRQIDSLNLVVKSLQAKPASVVHTPDEPIQTASFSRINRNAPSQEPARVYVEPTYVLTPTPKVRHTVRATSTYSNYYIRGPRGGCYYITGSGRKQYVDRSLCN